MADFYESYLQGDDIPLNLCKIEERANDMEDRIRILFVRSRTAEETIAEIRDGEYIFRGYATRSPRDPNDPMIGAVVAALRARMRQLAECPSIGRLDSDSGVFASRGWIEIPDLDRYVLRYVRDVAFNKGRNVQTNGKHPVAKSAIAYTIAMDILSGNYVRLELGQNPKSFVYVAPESSDVPRLGWGLT